MDNNKLNDLLLVFFETFGGLSKDGAKATVTGYKLALQGYSYERIEKAVSCLIKTWKPRYGSSRPTPAEIIEVMPPLENKHLQIEGPKPVSKEVAKENIKKINQMLKRASIGDAYKGKEEEIDGGHINR